MGMPVTVDIRDDEAGEDVLEAMFDVLRRADAIFSTYKDDSEISRLNRGELALADAHPDVREVLDRCEALRLETDGYFDVRAADPDVIDPSGLVKGWAVDRAAALLDEAGVRNYAVNVAGDMRLRGRACRSRAGVSASSIRSSRESIAAVVAGERPRDRDLGCVLARRACLDPHTHRPPTGVLSVTITGPELATADAYATAAFAMGAAGIHWTARLRNHEAMTILADQRVLKTPGFPS